MTEQAETRGLTLSSSPCYYLNCIILHIKISSPTNSDSTKLIKERRSKHPETLALWCQAQAEAVADTNSKADPVSDAHSG